MTLLHVAAGNAYGGIERMLVTLASTPHPAVRQEFAVSFGGRFERELQAAGVVVHRLPSPRASRPLMVWRARRAFMAMHAAAAPDVTIFHSAWPHAMFAAPARAGGARLCFWQHQPIASPAWPDRWARLVRPDVVVFNSHFTEAHPAFPSVPGHVIYCAVGEPPAITGDERQAIRASLGAGDGDVVVLMAARLERWKGHEILVKAAGLLPGDTEVRIWIAGAGSDSSSPYAAELSTAAGAARGRVALLGERGDVPALMRAADIYCQPNLKGEPFGIAIAEAMRAGLPCVVSAGGGAAELLDDSCGMVLPPGDPAALAAALQRLAAHPELRSDLGRTARVRAATLTDPGGRLQELADALSCPHPS